MSWPDRWVALDLSKPPRPTIDLVPRVLTARWITLFNGPPGAGKSYAHQALVAAALTGSDWLGLPVRGIDRVAVVDEENPPEVAYERLAHFGVKPEHRERLRYFSQIGCNLGEGTWAVELLAGIEDFAPQLVVIDSASSATNTAVNENDSISAMFSTVLRPLARTGAAVIVLHHDRKSGGQASDRVLGGVQWLGQVDRQVAFTKRAEHPITTEKDDGTIDARFPVTLSAGKSRQGVGIEPIRAAVLSTQAPDGTYTSTSFEVDRTSGTADTPRKKTNENADRLVAFLEDHGESRSADMAAALGVETSDGRFKRARAAAVDSGRIECVREGVYRVPST